MASAMANEGTIRIHRSIAGTGAAFRVTFVPYEDGEEPAPPASALSMNFRRFAHF